MFSFNEQININNNGPHVGFNVGNTINSAVNEYSTYPIFVKILFNKSCSFLVSFQRIFTFSVSAKADSKCSDILHKEIILIQNKVRKVMVKKSGSVYDALI